MIKMVGLLWQDGQDKITDRVNRAKERYVHRFGEQPDTCYVHPSELTDTQVRGIELRAVQTVQPGYYWIGVERANVKISPLP